MVPPISPIHTLSVIAPIMIERISHTIKEIKPPLPELLITSNI
jgi:hypothetical protein